MQVRDRIKELRRVRANLLRPNPRNWRTHPDAQRAALRDLLSEIGFADALLVRELPDGTLELIDGHLRAETTADMDVPVLVLDVNEAEAAKLLVTLDPLCSMAGTDRAVFDDLRGQIDTQSSAIQQLVDRVVRQGAASHELSRNDATAVEIPQCFQVVVECKDEAEQRSVYERLTAEGRVCRLLLL